MAMHPGQMLILVGEGEGGCTGHDSFWDLVRDGALTPCHEILEGADVWRFPGIHDHVMAFLRN